MISIGSHGATMNGRSVQIYGQIATLASRYSSAHTDYITGRTIYSNDGYRFNDSVLAAAGIRVDPLADHNLVLTLEKMFKIGRQARDDFRGRVGYSWDTGLELEPFEPNWLYTTFLTN